MQLALIIALCAFMALTFVAMIAGLFALARGGEFNRKYSNIFMQARIYMQAIALAVFAALLLFIQHSSS